MWKISYNSEKVIMIIMKNHELQEEQEMHNKIAIKIIIFEKFLWNHRKNLDISYSIFFLIYLLFWLTLYEANIKAYSLVWMPCFYTI